MTYYKDLREYIEALEKRNLLWRIKSLVKKETELMPVARWQYRGLSEEQRRAFLFEDVTDQKGRKYDIPVLVGALASSTAMCATALMCEPNEVVIRWSQGFLNPISPKLVASGPVHEVVYVGDDLKILGLDEFPIPTGSPGLTGLVRTTDSHFFSKDPETKIRNVGDYAGHVHARDRMTVGIGADQHMAMHLRKAQERGESLPAALVVGVIPAVAYASVSKVPYETDELAVAGGLAGEPIELVKCKTIDLEVPAGAEIVIEGEIATTFMEKNTGSFGEYTGFMSETHFCPVFNISCITHRKSPIFMAIMQEMPPSEGSKLNVIGNGAALYGFLKHDCNIPGILDVAYHESSGGRAYCVIQLKKQHPAEAWQALNAAVGYTSSYGKIIIVVDNGIDPRDADAVNWALSTCVQPHRDMRITMGKLAVLDPSVAPPGSTLKERSYPAPSGTSALLIDATRKWDYMPISLPKREYMERAREIWEAEGLPELKPRLPWFGSSLGYWSDEYQEAAEFIVRGEGLQLSKKKHEVKEEFHLD
ncbi:UbiD family decarboxylase [Chloroflexota bacterium]